MSVSLPIVGPPDPVLSLEPLLLQQLMQFAGAPVSLAIASCDCHPLQSVTPLSALVPKPHMFIVAMIIIDLIKILFVAVFAVIACCNGTVAKRHCCFYKDATAVPTTVAANG